MTFSSTDPDVSFHRIMQGALGHVDQFQQVAEQQQTAIDMGKSDDLAGAMIASQQASLSFSALVQVRNKIATGFNDLMSMSIQPYECTNKEVNPGVSGVSTASRR